MRLISNVGRDTSCRVLLKTFKYTPIAIYVYNVDCILNKNEHRRVRAELRHNYNTRHRSDLSPQFCRTDILKKIVYVIWG
jgi:hypothetical protein